MPADPKPDQYKQNLYFVMNQVNTNLIVSEKNLF